MTLEWGILAQHVDASVGMAVEASDDVAMAVAAHLGSEVHSVDVHSVDEPPSDKTLLWSLS